MKGQYHNEAEEAIAHIRSLQGNVPLHRRGAKHSYSFLDRPFAEQLAIWDSLWHRDEGFWVKVHATFFLEKYMKKEAHLKQLWPVVVKWQEKVDDWGLCDALAKIYTRALEVMPNEVYTQLQQWNTDKDPWKRRQSVVSLLYYSRTKKIYLPFDDIIVLITPLLTDKEYYVQKGVGWALRETYNVYPTQTMNYITANVNRITGIAFAAATEKLTAETKELLKAARRKK